ncbi:MAG: hypothetical protein IPN71_08725 [Fibrobacteres bacterium]|nr:hypothetical protein [Fibrobacterota bacterium]
MTWFGRSRPFECPNCGFEGRAPVRGAGPLLWIVLVAVAWNAWLFQRAHMEVQAVVAAVFALLGAWGAMRLPRWVRCPACGWRHPVGNDER